MHAYKLTAAAAAVSVTWKVQHKFLFLACPLHSAHERVMKQEIT
jgi:hypothetical protein